MSILNYLKFKSNLESSSPYGSLSRKGIPAAAIAPANQHVEEVLQQESKKRGQYNKYSPEERGKVTKYVIENDVQSAIKVQSVL